MATELTVENQDNIYRVHTYPVRIGRAKDNDIIVKAPFVADYHAVIEQGAQGLTIRSLEQSHANGERIPTTRPLTNNTLLQIGTATLKLWLDSGKPMPLAHKQRRWWPLFTHPVAVTAWFLAAIFLTAIATIMPALNFSGFLVPISALEGGAHIREARLSAPQPRQNIHIFGTALRHASRFLQANGLGKTEFSVRARFAALERYKRLDTDRPANRIADHPTRFSGLQQARHRPPPSTLLAEPYQRERYQRAHHTQHAEDRHD